LITNPQLSLVDHQERGLWGLLIGFLVLVGGGIAVAIEGRRWAKGKKQLIPAFLIIDLSIALLAAVSALWIVINEEGKKAPCGGLCSVSNALRAQAMAWNCVPGRGDRTAPSLTTDCA
jgi:hypothetical protein